MRKLTMPISDEQIRDLKTGDTIFLSGVMLTGRDAVHKWMIDTFIEKSRTPEGDDMEVYAAIKPHAGRRSDLPLRAGGCWVRYWRLQVRCCRTNDQYSRRTLSGTM